jgi:hypothetical protein
MLIVFRKCENKVGNGVALFCSLQCFAKQGHDLLLLQDITLDHFAYVTRWSLASFKVFFLEKINKCKSKSCHVDKGGQKLCLRVTIYSISYEK